MAFPRPHATNVIGRSKHWHYDRAVSIALFGSVLSNPPRAVFASIIAAGSSFNTQVLALLAAMAIVTPYALRTYRRSVAQRVAAEEAAAEAEAQLVDANGADVEAERALDQTTPTLISLSDEIDRWSDPATEHAAEAAHTLAVPPLVRSGSESLPAQLALAALADSARQSGWKLGQVDVSADGSLTASFAAASIAPTAIASVPVEDVALRAEGGGTLTSDSE